MYDDDYGPDERARYLQGLDAQTRRREWERQAIPAPSGSLAGDLSAADEAVQQIEREWDSADRYFHAVRAAAGPFPSPEQYSEIMAADRRRGELWRLRQRAVDHRARLEAQESAAGESWPAVPGDADDGGYGDGGHRVTR